MVTPTTLHAPYQAPFKAAWWLPGPHAQTLWASLCRRAPQPIYHRQRLELADGDFVDLDWAQPTQPSQQSAHQSVHDSDDSPLVVVLHGLEGSSQSNYVRGLVRVLLDLQIQALVLNFRGCSGEVNRLPRTYHSGETGDLDLIVRWLHHHYPQRAIALVGYSLGGNVVLKWLGERGARARVCTAVAACVPMQLDVCASRMERGFSRLYLWRLVGALRQKIALKFANRANNLDMDRVARSRSFWSFDEHATAPLHGFSGARDYYQRSSSRQFIPNIARPTLIVHAADDPFMSAEVLPTLDMLPAKVSLEISNGGGHVGFVAGKGLFGLVAHYWLERRVAKYIVEQLDPRAPR